MEPQNSDSQAQPNQEPVIDQAKLNSFLQEIRDNQNLPIGAAGGAGAAVVGAALWAAITYFSGYQIGWMAVGVGFLVGYAVRYAGKGIDQSFGIVGAIFALLGCLAGNLFASCAVIAEQESMALMDVISQLSPDIIVDIMTATFSPMHLLFYGIAVYEGYKFAFRPISEEELSRLTG